MITSAQAENSLFDDTLSCDDEFPCVLRAASGAYESAAAARRSEITLRAIGSLDESHAEETEGSGESVAPHVEAKIDLALSLLAMLLSHQQPLPAARHVRWSRHGFRVTWDTPLEPNAALICSVHLLAGLPIAVDIPVRLLACEPCGSGYTLWLEICDASPALRSAIERELFRRHRRVVHEHRVRRA